MPLGMYAEEDHVMCVADDGHALAVRCADVSLLSGAGKGVIVMKLAQGAQLLGAELGHLDLDTITVVTASGKERNLTLRSLSGARASRGPTIVRRGGFSKYVADRVETPSLEEPS